MKVTAIIPDDILMDVQKFTKGKNIMEGLVIALKDWIYTKRIDQLNHDLANEPVRFQEGFTAESIRKSNNRST